MLFPTMTTPEPEGASFSAFLGWHPDFEERDAASDYALDGMARSTGNDTGSLSLGRGRSCDRREDWLRYWQFQHRAGLA